VTTDELIREATARSAKLRIAPKLEPGELAHLVPALKRHLDALASTDVRTELSIAVPQWLPSAGATDIVLGATPPYQAVVEVKVYELGWCLWDLAKVASMIHGNMADAGYLIVSATTAKFAKPSEFGQVLRDSPGIVTADLFWTYAADWLDLLRGGAGRPVRLPARLQTELLVRERLHNVPGWEIRAIKVVIPPEPGEVRFASEAWPIGHPRLAEPRSPSHLPHFTPPLPPA